MTTPANSFVFENYFHPFVGELVEALAHRAVPGLLDPVLQAIERPDFFRETYGPHGRDDLGGDPTFVVGSRPLQIDVTPRGPYSVYNCELLLHVPILIAVHLTKSGRFAEARTWFHYVFDPTATGVEVAGQDPVPAPERYWKFIGFRRVDGALPRVEEVVRVLSIRAEERTAAEAKIAADAVAALDAMRAHPFEPHRVARLRPGAYQYFVLMRYIDNLIAEGDHHFRRDTAESLTEATALYVLASDILGPRPRSVPSRHRRRARSYAQLREEHRGPDGKDDLGPLGNALVEMENLLPFASAPPAGGAPDRSVGLLGTVRTPYFCVPADDRLLAYWDLVADRLHKIRSCQDISGRVRALALFEPAIDPAVLTRAKAAGVDLAGAAAAAGRPTGARPALTWLRKAQELAADVRSHGAALLAAMEKGDGERLSRLRQTHEVRTAELSRDVRYLGWKEAEENTEGLLRSRAAVVARYRHHQAMLGNPTPDQPGLDVTLARTALDEGNFETAYAELVGRYAGAPAPVVREPLRLAGQSAQQVQAGTVSKGELNLIPSEWAELNVHLPAAQGYQEAATNVDILFGILGMLPTMGVDVMPFGAGGHAEYGGALLSAVGHTLSSVLRGQADRENYQAGRAAKIAGYERRDRDLVQQSNQAALELAANGRQLIAALIHEQVARHEYENARAAITAAHEVDEFLAGKDTRTELYTWLRSEVLRTFTETYAVAVDVARLAEVAAKRELMRPELDAVSHIGYAPSSGRDALHAGERLALDLTRLELAYHEHNRREYELTKPVSLQTLDPLALLELRSTGTCTFAVPEWVFDLDTRGLYHRRLRSVALTLSPVAGSHTAIPCTVTLLSSAIRRSPLLSDGRYGRVVDGEDVRFLDQAGALESVVTSTGVADTGLFDGSVAGDDRYPPFFGAGAVSRWRLTLPPTFRPFTYRGIGDAVLTLRYTARDGVDPAAVSDDLRQRFAAAKTSELTRATSLRDDHATEWAAFRHGAPLTVQVRRAMFPYLAQSSRIVIDSLDLRGVGTEELAAAPALDADLEGLTDALDRTGAFSVDVPVDDDVVRRDDGSDPYLLVKYSLA